MKGNKSHPRYSRRVVRREIARRLKAEARALIAEATLKEVLENVRRYNIAQEKAWKEGVAKYENMKAL